MLGDAVQDVYPASPMLVLRSHGCVSGILLEKLLGAEAVLSSWVNLVNNGDITIGHITYA